ncbi:hypothetical protein DEI91_05075 [Curtobacterium sp. MCBD17_032]|nr:hypothetical protein DEI91_05075 [Curtobacterium sp. MCBD17_032]
MRRWSRRARRDAPAAPRVRGSAGAALAAESRRRYGALAAVAVGLAAAVYSGPTGTHVPVAAWASAVAVVVVLAAGVRLWPKIR